MSDEQRRRGILSEVTVHREGRSEEENPYWLAEEAQPHPNPELGCIRRGLCCKSHPGWFGPGQVERAAELKGMTPDDFVKQYLVVDWLDLDGERIHVFAPAKIAIDGDPLYPTGKVVDTLYQLLRSPCIFYNGDGCRIYQSRPIECERYVCTNMPEDNISHAEIARMWRDAAET